MQNATNELRDVVARLVKEIEARAQRKGKPAKLRPHPPADAAQIAAYEQYLGLRLPASYRAFLELHDGYDGLAAPGSMLSSRALMPGGELHDTVLEWKKSNAEYGMGEVMDGIMIANLDEPNNWTFLDPTRQLDGGEFTVVQWLNGDTNDYANLVEYFEDRISYCRTY